MQKGSLSNLALFPHISGTSKHGYLSFYSVHFILMCISLNVMSDFPLTRTFRLTGAHVSIMPRRQNCIWKMVVTSLTLEHLFRPLFCLQGNVAVCREPRLYESCQSTGKCGVRTELSCVCAITCNILCVTRVLKVTQTQQYDQYIQM